MTESYLFSISNISDYLDRNLNISPSAWFSLFLQSLRTLTVTRQHLTLGAFSPLEPHDVGICLIFKHLSTYWDDFFQQVLTEHLLHGRHCNVVKPKKFLLIWKLHSSVNTLDARSVQLNMVKIYYVNFTTQMH